VPGGTVESGEDLVTALWREIKEETGLTNLRLVTHLVTAPFHAHWRSEWQERNVFHVAAGPDVPDTWTHIVNSGEEDAGLHFLFTWWPIDVAARELKWGQGQWLHLLSSTNKASSDRGARDATHRLCISSEPAAARDPDIAMEEGALLREQIEYYRARAGEYDEWFFRQGRYDRGPDHRAQWLGEIALVEEALRATLPRGRVLELACGTGLWTRPLARWHEQVVAVDISPEAIAINRDRVNSPRVDYVVADLFDWLPLKTSFDAVFLGFWLSHVPPSRFDELWAMVGAALKPGAVDSMTDGNSVS
jgi:2-polyprenyl-3-methyl-5-hydroxy-6-metoxy-1,4-benzoquinol methylase